MKKIYIITLLSLAVSSFSQGIDSKLIKGNKLYDEKAYSESMAAYEKVASSGFKSIELFEKLGDAYFFNSEFSEANKWYTELFGLIGFIDPIYYYRYSQTLKSIGDDKNANDYLSQFSKLSNTDSRAVEYVDNKNYLSQIKDNSERYDIKDLDINTAYSDYGVAIYQDRSIVFASSRIPENGKSDKDGWTLDNYSSLYSAMLSKDGSLGNAQPFASELHTKYHESNPTFSNDGKVVFFTRNSDKAQKVNSMNVVPLKIYKSTFENGKWGNVVELPFNSEDFSCAHPALSADNKILYFTSNMPGGFGNSDIYRVSVDVKTNTYGKPVNLGKNINTQGKEAFPWISADNKLYFASDGHLGLGGLDVFRTTILKDDLNSKVENIGKPINSSFDDFGFLQLDNSDFGFFTSNRDGGKGKDDIYSFTEDREFAVEMEYMVVSKETQKAVAHAEITIYDKNHTVVGTTKTDRNGLFKAIVDSSTKGKTYYVKGIASGYEKEEVVVESNDINLKKGTILLNLPKILITKGSDIAKILSIKEILFDTGKSNVRVDMEVELEKVLTVLEQNPNMKIDIRSHTDSRGSAASNKLLSDKRAKATRLWFISSGINATRLTAKGYGEERLLNKCSDGVKCTEEEHQMNRRSEFIVLN
ncbi:outer membrane protein OmpA-like peptidoglycan-associated protein [Flavobacterium sp. 9]|uniref:OmpA family protein n=1 Tax=Flavobacterium sp. 9 TaxID=2035198 RepID=UPI000C179BDC|nr:OmpA family protein [Flavobacterium sp. 9]PIF30178.1 outer membrane protein OmpA-like peptidoglycan-associated protein [Flavobacterium sp. 9]